MAPPIVSGSGRIFISYRREETAYPAGWLYDRLVERFGDGQVFKDIDSIVLGDDFVEVITQAVESCDVLLALIGDDWVTVTDADGRRRIDDPEDFVRLEIEAAMSRNVRVIPILVDGARMPRAEDLPESLSRLVRRQALELSPSRFDFDTDRLVRVLDRSLSEARGEATTDSVAGPSTPPSSEPGPSTPAPTAPPAAAARRRSNLPVMIGVGAVLLIAVVVIAVLVAGGGGDSGDGGSGTGGSGTLRSSDDIELSDVEHSVGSRRPVVGDTVTVSFTLTNVGDDGVTLEGSFVGARNAADDNLDTDYSNVDTELAPGDSVGTEAQIQFDSAGTWLFWPCYALTNGSACPDEWGAFRITVED
jgi:hypothetical protein